MRIISRFQDYYDRAMAHGADQTRVFVRETTEYGEYSKTQPVPELLKEFNSLVLSRESRGNISLDPFIVGFAGKLYPGVHCHISAGTYPTNPGQEQVSEAFYDLESFLAFAEKHSINLTRRFFFDNQTRKQRYAAFFDLKGSTRCQAAFAELGVAIALARGQVVVNPQLKAVEFFRVFDAWQAYQELDMYLGALAAPDTKPPVQVADKDRITQHGFDKQSFRTRPRGKARAA